MIDLTETLELAVAEHAKTCQYKPVAVLVSHALEDAPVEISGLPVRGDFSLVPRTIHVRCLAFDGEQDHAFDLLRMEVSGDGNEA